MSWITAVQADNFLNPNPEWDTFENKDELLKLSSNRLEQLTFKGEPIDRVGARYIDGSSVSKVAGSDDFLLEAEAGNFAYHATLGWTRGVATQDLVIYEPTNNVVFSCHDDDAQNYTYEQKLTLKQIQSLHSFGGIFGGTIILDLDDGTLGSYSSIETQQANAIVDPITGDQVYTTYPNRRILYQFVHNGVNVQIHSAGIPTGLVLNGINEVTVTNEQGEEVVNTVPNVLAGARFSYQAKIINGLNNNMFLYIDDILIGNPEFNNNAGGKGGNRLFYQSGSGGGVDRVTYIREFGAKINTENPITIPIRLVGACALLALQYGKFPPKFIGNQAYLENENDYPRMQDLPINVQAALEPFLADYEGVIDEDGIATVTERGEEPSDPEVTTLTQIEHFNE